MHFAPEPSGNAPYTTSLAEALVARGHSVHVLTGTPHYPQWRVYEGYGQWSSTSTEQGVQVRRLRHYVANRPDMLRRSLMEATFGLRLATQRMPEIDVSVSVSPALLSTAILAATRGRRPRTPSLLWVQDLYSRGIVETQRNGSGLAARAMTAVERATVKSFPHVVVAHDRFRERLVADLGASENDVRVIKNWVRIPARVADPSTRRRTRERLGWSSDEVVCVHAGNMGVKQGLENVVDAARAAGESARELRFVLLGHGNQQPRLRELAEGLPNLSFVDSLDDHEFRLALEAADVLLVNERPGVMEMSVPSKLTSYLASGRPVIAAVGRGSVTEQEVLRSGGGVCVAAGQPRELVNAVRLLGKDTTRADALGARGRAFAEAELSEDSAIDRFEATLFELVAPNTQHRG